MHKVKYVHYSPMVVAQLDTTKVLCQHHGESTYYLLHVTFIADSQKLVAIFTELPTLRMDYCIYLGSLTKSFWMKSLAKSLVILKTCSGNS